MIGNWHIYLVICTVGLVIAVIIANIRRIKNLLHFGTAFLCLMYITYVIRPYLAYTISDGMTFLNIYLPGTSELVVHDLDRMALAFILSILFFSVGYRLLKRPDITINSINDKAQKVNKFKLFRIFAILLIIIGYFSFIWARRGFLSEGSAEYIRYSGGVVFANTTGYIEYANYLIVAGAILFYASTRKFGITLLLTTPWLINQIYTGWQRYMFLNLAIGLAIVAIINPIRSKIKVKIKIQAISAVIILVTAFSLLLLMRNNRMFARTGGSLEDILQSTISVPIDQTLGDFAGFEGAWYSIHYFDSIKPYYGASIFYRYLILPIPRLLWPEKPLKVEFTWASLFSTGTNTTKWRSALINADDYVWYNTAVKGSIGYALEEWGWIGIPINFFFTGLFFALIEKKFILSDFSPAWISTYAATYALITAQGRNDLFEFLLVFLLIFYLPFIFIQYINNHHKRVLLRYKINFEYKIDNN